MTEVEHLEGLGVFGDGNAEIGTVAGVYTDDHTGRPTWAAVTTGGLGAQEVLLPLAAATITADGLTVPYSQDMVRAAPHTDPDGALTESEQRDLYRYFDVEVSDTAAGDSPQAPPTGPGEAMTRSAEHLAVGLQTVESSRVRFRKYVVTEMVTQTVPVRREELRAEPVPAGEIDTDAAVAGAIPAGTDPREIVLHAERPVVTTEVVPVERVRLITDRVRQDVEIDDTLRQERIDVESP